MIFRVGHFFFHTELILTSSDLNHFFINSIIKTQEIGNLHSYSIFKYNLNDSNEIRKI